MVSSTPSQDKCVQTIIEKQRLLIEARNQDLIALKNKLAEYQTTINEKDYYVAKLEMDLEHAIGQFKKITAARMDKSNK